MEVQGILENFPNAKGNSLMRSTTSSMLKDCLHMLSLEEDQTIIGSHEELREGMFYLGEIKVPMLPMKESSFPTLVMQEVGDPKLAILEVGLPTLRLEESGIADRRCHVVEHLSWSLREVVFSS